MPFDPELAEMRFGAGLSPAIAPPAGVAAMLDRLRGPDDIAARFPIEDFTAFLDRMEANRAARRARGKSKDDPEAAARHLKEQRLVKRDARIAQGQWLGMQVQRRVHTADGLRERLVTFWADHFTAQGKAGVMQRAASPYVETAIRPHVTGRFADLVAAATTAPLMLHYLDQESASGPNSVAAQALLAEGRVKRTGLNENLARELLELHTLGVTGGYGQEDVRELAELLTGLTYQPQVGFKFQHKMAEPGAETVLGVSYGGGPGNAQLSDIKDALDALATHPDTGRHIARKLAVHFVTDDPDPALVDHLAATFAATRGDLMAVYAALLDHPAAWDPVLHNVKPPFDFLASAWRALALAPDAFLAMDEPGIQRNLRAPLARMGQPWERPVGPDGWPEDDAAWINPLGLSARLDWAMNGPGDLGVLLPDPRDFVRAALGSRAPPEVMFAASAAENRREGIGLVLVSPAFQRR